MHEGLGHCQPLLYVHRLLGILRGESRFLIRVSVGSGVLLCFMLLPLCSAAPRAPLRPRPRQRPAFMSALPSLLAPRALGAHPVSRPRVLKEPFLQGAWEPRSGCWPCSLLGLQRQLGTCTCRYPSLSLPESSHSHGGEQSACRLPHTEARPHHPTSAQRFPGRMRVGVMTRSCGPWEAAPAARARPDQFLLPSASYSASRISQALVGVLPVSPRELLSHMQVHSVLCWGAKLSHV